MTSVYVAMPTLGWIRVELAHILRQISHDRRCELIWPEPMLGMRPTPSARHGIINGFLAGDADYLLMLDSDVIPYANPLDLIEHDLDVVSMACPIWSPANSPPVILNATPLDGSQTIALGGGMIEVTQASTSVILIARRVLEHPDVKNPFGFQYDENGLTVIDDDITFFWKAREAGFKVWVSLDHVCGHMKEIDIVRMRSAVKEWR